MDSKRRANITSFKPGQSGNPNGRPKTPEDIKEARKLNRFDFERIVNELWWMPPEELLAVLKDENTPAIKIMVARIIVEASKEGDPKRAEFLLQRTIGTVKVHVSMDGGENAKGEAQPIKFELHERIQQLKEGK